MINHTKINTQLNNLLSGIVDIDKSLNCLITGITIDSRETEKGDLFFAYRGIFADHRYEFIKEAVAKGAAAVLCEDELPQFQKNTILGLVPIIIIPNLKELAGLIASKFYQNPSDDMTIIGITGTNGKTSIANFIAHTLKEAGIKCGIIGTIGFGFAEKLSPLTNTTPDAVTLQKILYKFKQEKTKVVAMEVSSHSLAQHRVRGINFKIAIFTNLTRDHLDYHKTMENYYATKKMLFIWPGLQFAIINTDDNFGLKLFNELKTTKTPPKIYAYTCKNNSDTTPPFNNKISKLIAHNIQTNIKGVSAKVITPWGTETMASALLGKFNIYNLLAVLAVLGIMDIDFNKNLGCIRNLHATAGRLQTISIDNKPLVIIDYSHTPDALEKALTALQECCSGKLWCVFGCGGNRDRGKRPIMGKIAENYSDHLIITNDNPRTEDPAQIINEITQGLTNPSNAIIQQDRFMAITYAIKNAKTQDIILIAGKGHEDYQLIGNKRIHFSDKETVEKIFDLKT